MYTKATVSHVNVHKSFGPKQDRPAERRTVGQHVRVASVRLCACDL